MVDNNHLQLIPKNNKDFKNTFIIESKNKPNNNSFDKDNKFNDQNYDKIDNKSSNSFINFDKYKGTFDDIEKIK